MSKGLGLAIGLSVLGVILGISALLSSNEVTPTHKPEITSEMYNANKLELQKLSAEVRALAGDITKLREETEEGEERIADEVGNIENRFDELIEVLKHMGGHKKKKKAEIKANELPKNVFALVKKNFKDAKIKRIRRHDKEGNIYFEIKGEYNDELEFEMTIGEDGTIWEKYSELKYAQLPPSIKKQVAKRQPKFKFEFAEQELNKKETFIIVEGYVNKEEHVFVFDQGNDLVEYIIEDQEQDLEFNEKPQKNEGDVF